jgi:tetratricopeptide (TPR) repeat protein
LGLLKGYKHKKARSLLLEGRKKLPQESLDLFLKARKIFREVDNFLMAQIAEAEYYRSLAKIQLRKGELESALENFKKSKAIFSKLKMWDDVSSVSKEIYRLYSKFYDLSEVKKTIRTYLLAIDVKKVGYEEATRMCNALCIDADTLNQILSELENEGLLKFVGDGYVVLKDEVRRIEVTYKYQYPKPLVERITCPICGAPIEDLKNVTKCEFCGAYLKLNISDNV